MIAPSLLDPFRRIELFAGLTPFQVSEIARRSERVMFRSDDVIAKSGEASDAAILIVDGKVECTEGLPSRSKDPHIEPGTLLAEMAMFTEFEYAATFVARSSVKAIRITREEILAQMEDDHIKAFEAMRDEYARADKKSDVVDADDEATLYLRAVADGKVFASDPSEDLSGNESIKDILTIAVALEKDAVIFYQSMRGAASRVIRVESLDAIIKEEIGHILDLIGQLKDIGK